jgi:hypothetical protein
VPKPEVFRGDPTIWRKESCSCLETGPEVFPNVFTIVQILGLHAVVSQEEGGGKYRTHSSHFV